MSVFDKLRGGGGPAKISSKAAMLLGCILMASADGEVDDDELAIVRRLDGHGSTENWDTAVRAFKRNDRSTCFNMVCDSINSDHVMPFLANLVDMAMADGSLHGQEKNLLEGFVEKLSADADAVGAIVDVIGLKNSISTL